MKRYGNLFEQIISPENCKEAILNASRGKRGRKTVAKIIGDIDFYAEDLAKRIGHLEFTSPYVKRIIRDGLSGKERELQIPSFYPDQCAHHAIMQIIQPIFLKSAYYWSCANIKGRGIDRACRGVEKATRRDIRNAKYCVKMDISKFYRSIPHDKLKARIREKIKDKRCLAILDRVIDTHREGIPIGNYTSPWFAEFYLQPLDYFIKQELRVKHYIRYADDLVLCGSNKRKLRKAMHRIIERLSEMGLAVKSNYQLFRVQEKSPGRFHRRGRKIDFVGKCFGIKITAVRKRRALAFMRQARYIVKCLSQGREIDFKTAAGFLSRCSLFRYTDSKGLKRKYFDGIKITKLREVISNESKRRRFARDCSR